MISNCKECAEICDKVSYLQDRVSVLERQLNSPDKNKMDFYEYYGPILLHFRKEKAQYGLCFYWTDLPDRIEFTTTEELFERLDRYYRCSHDNLMILCFDPLSKRPTYELCIIDTDLEHEGLVEYYSEGSYTVIGSLSKVVYQDENILRHLQSYNVC